MVTSLHSALEPVAKCMRVAHPPSVAEAWESDVWFA